MRRFLFSLLISGAMLASLAVTVQARQLKIVTDITPVQAIVKAVANGRQDVSRLVPLNVTSHDFTLKPSDLRALQSADLIVWLGPDATPGLAKLMARPEMMTKALTLSALPDTKLLPLRKSGTLAAKPTPLPLIRGRADPHIWLSPENVRHWAGDIAARLSKLDPENRTTYGSGRSLLDTGIAKADARIRQDFRLNPPVPFVQFHDSLQYFEAAYGLHPLGVATAADEEATSLGIVVSLKAALARYPRSCVFVATRQQAIRARALLETRGVRTGYADPLGRNIRAADFTYPALLLSVAKGFSDCFAKR